MFWSHLLSATLTSLSALAVFPPYSAPVSTSSTCQSLSQPPNFLVVAGGGNPATNEIALEKNVLYFQRVLKYLGYNPEQDADFFFANGNDGQLTVRYLDENQEEKFKVPQIPFLKGSSTLKNLTNWFQAPLAQSLDRGLFLYFTGHGLQNQENTENNTLLLWDRQQVSVQEFAQLLDLMPAEKPVVTMMAQCYSGSFANIIYEGGNSENPVAPQTRCGFFATVETLPSVGCTPEVNEADYVDYSSSFFAGLSGQKRTGERADSADYNQDGRISYIEAHAFAKVDNKSIDLPLSTSENWLRQKASEAEIQEILKQPIATVMKTARPEQVYVINQLMETFEWNHLKSYLENLEEINPETLEDEVQEALAVRLMLELVNVGMEDKVRQSDREEDLAILNRLLECEQGSWR
ncbi:caspase family protein [Roseofilum reptotaenium CS-1145]|uniref:Caspase domain-containing protein n=1 Tax=Roseofilum reptotaenium AO1-A TaxID=1925591 RepID=A0A1L9QMF9_9CYAN|nr:caspase family protein [Roseofilum reptotaenium]MDB9516501.1 caspase family protein [Roseofilum reptotaenium CS-1145]OJJ22249.1 Caspase domain-containing protein [Roseofilum reptotaenium AO1-A]